MSPEEHRETSEALREQLTKACSLTRCIGEDTYVFPFVAGPFVLDCFCEIGIEEGVYVVVGIFPILIEPERRAVVGEYLHWVNYPIAVGGWAINPDDGQVRWRLGFYFGDSVPSTEMMFEAVQWSVHFIKEHILGLVKLSLGRSLDEALRSIGEDPEHGNDLLAEWEALQAHGAVGLVSDWESPEEP
jgi:hypothetical protein